MYGLSEGTRKAYVIWEILMGDDHVYFKDPNGEYVSCTFCARVQMRRPHDSYLWFNYETNRGHQNSLLIAISENTTKEGIKWPATKKLLLCLLVS